jgi:hypothetical protein
VKPAAAVGVQDAAQLAHRLRVVGDVLEHTWLQ